jgi:serine/threonine protein kinase/tetratricopeptide (TPR) repeat protein
MATNSSQGPDSSLPDHLAPDSSTDGRRRDSGPCNETCLPPTRVVDSPPSLTSTNPRVRALIEAMAQSWAQGKPLMADEALAADPDLVRQREVVLRLITEEMCLWQEAGQEPPADHYVRRFPTWKAEIEALVECQSLLEREVSLEIGGPVPHKLRDFQILTELGQGGQGRVYLATQPFLGDRPVVLKITPCRGSEHLALARLQHTHIVPLYWAQEDPHHKQRILCMPYFGGVTLADVARVLKPVPLAERSGRHLLGILDQAEVHFTPAATSSSPARQLIVNKSYDQCIVWMASCLADALHYAHERDLIHLDVKASNVLWTNDGQVMLLDFHLAHHPFGPKSDKPVGLGGTPGFMSPEQEASLKAVCEGRPVTRTVDRRSDIYSLGILMYQALGGAVPRDAQSLRLDRINPQVSTGLADMVERCLAADPEKRYPQADLLATDLRRHLSDLPLRGVPNRSWSERWTKWRRRHPQALKTRFLVGTLLALLGLAGWWSWTNQQERRRHQDKVGRENLAQARDVLEQGKKLLEDKEYDLALKHLNATLPSLPDGNESQEIVRSIQELRGTAELSKLFHAALDELRVIAVAETVSLEQRSDVDRKCALLWEKRALYLPAGDKDVELRRDIIDLALIWSELAPGPDLVRVLREVQERWGDNKAVGTALAENLRAPWESRVAPQTFASPWERIAWARALMGPSSMLGPIDVTGGWGALASPCPNWAWTAKLWQETESERLRRADLLLRQAIREDRQNYWAHYYQGVSAYRRGQAAESVRAFSVAVALAPKPQLASCYYHRGLAAVKLKDLDPAFVDFGEALKLDSHFGRAAWNRALIHKQRAEYGPALEDLDRAQGNGVDPEQVRTTRLLILKKLQAKTE